MSYKFASTEIQLTFTVDKQDYVLAKGLVQASMHRKNLDHLISQMTRRRPLIDRIMSRNHKLLVENQLQATN
jgi:hypothetical protein